MNVYRNDGISLSLSLFLSGYASEVQPSRREGEEACGDRDDRQRRHVVHEDLGERERGGR